MDKQMMPKSSSKVVPIEPQKSAKPLVATKSGKVSNEKVILPSSKGTTAPFALSAAAMTYLSAAKNGKKISKQGNVEKIYASSESTHQDAVSTYKDLVILPYKIRVTELEMRQEMNEHATLHLIGVIPEEEQDQYVHTTSPDTDIEVLQMVGDGQAVPIFNGIAQDVEVKVVQGIYYLDIKAISRSFLLDVTKKSQTYQDVSMSYVDLIKASIKDQPGADSIDRVSNGAAIGEFTMQYLETDWEFLKRMASRFNSGLVPDIVFPEIKFYFGIPFGSGDVKELDAINYSVKKMLGHYLISSKNHLQGVGDNDYIYYEVESTKVLKIGNEVSFQSRKLSVNKILTTLKDGLLKHVYTLAPKKGFSVHTTYNTAIIGASIQGKVIDIGGDKIRIQVDFDESQDVGTAYWFPYSTIYASEDNTGWYCMPEKGDSVRVYFPGNKEEEGIAISSVSKSPPQTGAMMEASKPQPAGASVSASAAPSGGGGNGGGGGTSAPPDSRQDPARMADPDVKTLCTKHGKQIMLAPDKIVISGGGMTITLTDGEGIAISSNKDIKLTATEKVAINAKQIMVNASEKITMKCNDNKITMKEKIKIKGTEIRSN